MSSKKVSRARCWEISNPTERTSCVSHTLLSVIDLEIAPLTESSSSDLPHAYFYSWSWVGRSSKVVHDTGLTSQPIGPIHVSSQPRIQQMTARASKPDSLLNSFLNKIDIYKVNCELHVLILILIYMWVLCGLRVLYNYLAEIFAPRSSSMEPELSTQ